MHRTSSINEVSGRYVQLPNEWYIPEVVGGAAANKKQGQENNLPVEDQAWFKRKLVDQCNASYALYEAAIGRGVAMEHARLFLHLNHYTHWLFKMDLRNLMHFLALRDHSHAQVESREYARAIAELLEPHVPGLMNLYRELVREE